VGSIASAWIVGFESPEFIGPQVIPESTEHGSAIDFETMCEATNGWWLAELPRLPDIRFERRAPAFHR
jgi:hypothetical protein